MIICTCPLPARPPPRISSRHPGRCPARWGWRRSWAPEFPGRGPRRSRRRPTRRSRRRSIPAAWTSPLRDATYSPDCASSARGQRRRQQMEDPCWLQMPSARRRGKTSHMIDLLRFVSGLATDLVRRHGELIAENALLRQQLIVAHRKVPGRVRWAVVCQNRSPRLDDGSAACEPWTAMSLALALWGACARRSEPAPTLHSRTWRSDSSSPCSAVDQSDRDSGASIAPSGYGSPTGGLDGARRSISYAPRP